MRVATGLLNLFVGTVYTGYGLMTVLDLKRGWRQFGFSHFTLAWMGIALTCGPHHFDHAVHLLLYGRAGGGIDLLTVLAGVVPGLLWVFLRVEAFLGGRGDRTIAGTPWWIEALPTFTAAYLAVVAAGLVAVTDGALLLTPNMWPQGLLAVLYGATGVLLLRILLRNHAVTGTWSLSGLSFGYLMVTCSTMHAAVLAYSARGAYDVDGHGLTFAALAVPAAAYFLGLTWAVYRGWLRDWDVAPEVRATREAVPA